MKIDKGDERTVRNALYAAAQWEDSLVESWGGGTPEAEKARLAAAEYRTLRNSLFPGHEKDGVLPDGPTISVFELAKRESR